MSKTSSVIIRLFIVLSVCIPSYSASGAPGSKSPDSGAVPSENSASRDVTSRPKIGLVLSGGGARGAAHIGVLKVLEEYHVPVDMIAGTSFGAIVGGLYASGYSAAELEQILTNIDWQQALSSSAPRSQRSFQRKEDDDGFLIKLNIGIKDGDLRLPTGLITPNNLRLTLRDLVSPIAERESFDDLAIPFRAVATDLETGQAVTLGKGDLTSAMIASMAVPGLFPPVERDGKLLVDGGVSNNVPVDVARAMGADIVIVIDISSPLQAKEDMASLPQVINQLALILTNQSAAAQLATLTDEDVIIRPILSGISTVNFENASKAVPRGEDSARQVAAALQRLSLPPEAWQAYQAEGQGEVTPSPVVEFIRIVNTTELSDALISSRLRLKPGDTLDAQTMSADMTKLYGLELFEEISYSVVEEDGRTGVEVRARPPVNGESRFRFGLALQDNFEGESGFTFAVGYIDPAVNSLGGEWRVLLNVGDTLGVSSEFYQPVDPTGRGFVFAQGAARKTNVNIINREGQFLRQVRISEAAVQSGAGMNFGQWGAARIGLQKKFSNLRGHIGFDEDLNVSSDQTTLVAAFAIDTLDSVLFPHTGVNFSLEYENELSLLGGDGRVDTLTVGAYIPKTWGRNTVGLRAIVASSFNGTPDESNLFPLGGFLNLTAYAPGQLTGNHGGALTTVYYRRIAGGTRYLAQTPIYFGGSLETGNLWTRRSDVSLNDLRWSSSVFVGADTPLGPLYLGAAVGDGGQTSAFLFVGQLF